MIVGRKKAVVPTQHEALPGRDTPLKVPERHSVNGHRIIPPFPAGMTEAILGHLRGRLHRSDWPRRSRSHHLRS